MKYQQQSSLSGAWVDKTKIHNGQRAKIVSEAKSMPSNFQDDKGNVKNQDVAKVHFEGDKEAVNVSLNRATINGLISAFGDDSVNWMGHYLTAEVEKVRVAGKSVTAMYLIPEGYEKVDDDEGYAVIQKKNVKQSEPEIPIIGMEDEIDDKSLPF